APPLACCRLSSAPLPASPRFDLVALVCRPVPGLLVGRRPAPLGRPAVDAPPPLPTPEAANRAAAIATELAAQAARQERPPVGGAVEVRSWLPAFFAGEHQPEARDLAALKRLLRATARCRLWLAGRSDAPALVAFAATFPAVGDVAEELERVVDDRGEVLSSASLRLAQVRAEIDAAEAAVRAAVARFLADEGV